MRKLIYALIIAALCLAPLKRADIAKLRPVQAFAMYLEVLLWLLKKQQKKSSKKNQKN